MKFLFRSVAVGFLRFLVSLSLLTALFYLDVSPLPEAPTYTALSFLIHFGITFLSALWVFGRHVPTWGETGMVFVIFAAVGTFMEGLVQAWISRVSWLDVLRSLNWQSLIVFAVYALAVFLAAWWAKRRSPSIMPEGMQA